MTITANSSIDEVLRYFDVINMNAWHCPETERIIDAETCLECYIDALENIDTDPDDTCLSCTSAKRAYNWEYRRKKVKKQSDIEWIEKISKSHVEQKEQIPTAQKLADEHWGYIANLLAVSMPPDKFSETIEMIAYHYKTAFVHGWKHRGEC